MLCDDDRHDNFNRRSFLFAFVNRWELIVDNEVGVDNESLNISDNRKTVSFSLTFPLKIQVNRTNQIIRTVAAVLSTSKQIWF